MGVEKRRAVFLDRDGTLNEEKDYLYRIEDFVFIRGVPESIQRLKKAGFLVIVVTNQSGVARGYFTLAEVETLHRHIQKKLNKYGAGVDGFYVCPHHPDQGVGAFRKHCNCRKGEPGLLLQAAADFGIDLTRSFMIGDKLADLQAGTRAGCRPILVLTGYGVETSQRLKSDDILVFGDLGKAANFILSSNC